MDSQSLSYASMALCDVNNTAHWIGLYETNDDQNLIEYLGAYLIFIAAAMVFSTVSYYQIRKRFILIQDKANINRNSSKHPLNRLMNGDCHRRPKVLFDGVTREDADKSVILLVKYLFNYGFYKFGIEITFIALTTLICVRKDILSIIYIIWLCISLCLQRHLKQFIWPIFQNFITITIIMQYAVILNLPSFLESCKYIE